MNRVILMGRLTRDADVRYGGANNTAVANFSLAVDRRFKREGDSQTADFINCVAFEKTAEFMEKFGRKGVKFVVEGELRNNNYQKDGETVYRDIVRVSNIEFAESKGSGAAAPTETPDNTDADGFMNIPDGIEEDLPFN